MVCPETVMGRMAPRRRVRERGVKMAFMRSRYCWAGTVGVPNKNPFMRLPHKVSSSNSEAFCLLEAPIEGSQGWRCLMLMHIKFCEN